MVTHAVAHLAGAQQPVVQLSGSSLRSSIDRDVSDCQRSRSCASVPNLIIRTVLFVYRNSTLRRYDPPFILRVYFAAERHLPFVSLKVTADPKHLRSI